MKTLEGPGTQMGMIETMWGHLGPLGNSGTPIYDMGALRPSNKLGNTRYDAGAIGAADGYAEGNRDADVSAGNDVGALGPGRKLGDASDDTRALGPAGGNTEGFGDVEDARYLERWPNRRRWGCELARKYWRSWGG